MKKSIIILLLLSHSFLAMADEIDELIEFIKENSAWVGKYSGAIGELASYCGSTGSSYSHIFALNRDTLNDINLLLFRNVNLTSLPSNLFLLPNLYKITIDNVNLESFPKIDTLKCLDFKNIKFDKIAKDVFENGKLIELSISDLNLTSLPENISKLKNLYSLNLSSNQLKTLPNEIGELTNLGILNLENNQLKELPKEFGNLSNLSLLYLANNQLEILPKEFGGLLNLGLLDLNNNKLEALPAIHPRLGILSIHNNQLKKLPDNFGDMTNLYELDLSNNELKNLPDSFINLKNLRDLYLSSNKLNKLPKDFFAIFETQHPEYYQTRGGASLHISNNRISFLDKSICKAFAFGEFFFYDNYFDTLPKCFDNATEGYSDGLFTFAYIYSIIDINGNYITTNSNNRYDMKKFMEEAGWKVSKNIIEIDYSFKNFFFNDEAITFKPILGDDFNITSYLWNFGNGNTSTDETPTHIYKNYGEYNVTLTINSDKTFSKLITISPRILELKKGWNMITPPTKDDINTNLFSETWSYQNEKWENSHEYLIPTIGYWVKLNEDLNYSYSGEVYELPNYKIKNGWDFMGSGEKYLKKSNETIYQYKNSEWIINPNEIKRGEGFWIKK